MSRFGAVALAACFAFVSVSGVEAATVTRLFGGTITSTNGDFAGIGAGNLPKDFILKVTFNDTGAPSFITGDWMRLDGMPPDIPFMLGNLLSNYVVTNGGNDTLGLNLITNVTGNGEALNFVISRPGTTVADSSKSIANVNALLADPYVSGTAGFTWINSATGTGYSGVITAVPEPSSMALLVGGVLGFGYWKRRRSKQSKLAA